MATTSEQAESYVAPVKRRLPSETKRPSCVGKTPSIMEATEKKPRASRRLIESKHLGRLKVCAKCACPLTLLRTETGWSERRRYCVRCVEARATAPASRTDRRIAYQREYRASNAEKAREAAREWYRLNRDAVNEKRKKLRLDSPEAVREAARAHYARRAKQRRPVS